MGSEATSCHPSSPLSHVSAQPHLLLNCPTDRQSAPSWLWKGLESTVLSPRDSNTEPVTPGEAGVDGRLATGSSSESGSSGTPDGSGQYQE